MHHLHRREFAAVAVAGVLGPLAGAGEPSPIIDTHTHFYDPSRPGGVDWPGRDDKVLYRPTLPPEFVKLTQPHGVTGTVVVEASPRLADNDWLLDLAAKHPVIVGVVGRLDPANETFDEQLKRLAKNPLYRGFRINHAELAAVLNDPKLTAKLGQLIDLDLRLDVNGGPEGLPVYLRLAKRFPKLRIVLNHIGNVRIDGKTIPAGWKTDIARLGEQPVVTCKLSAMVEASGKSGGKAPRELDYYRPTMDVVWKAFGEDRLMYGSDWPVANLFASYATVFAIIEEYLKDKPAKTRAKVLGENAIKAYGLNSKS